ncbi:protein-L-isoaspartate O-methyltransferase [Inhella sp.]|uniref:protein-L-isoaspartate O-methyltransferase family protein n=1 Tax=Inhella sp. TaxID=1921806 RepID=UPI0035B4A2C4
MSRRAPGGVLRPQRLLHEATRDSARLRPPSGIGLDSPGVRMRMVERLRQLKLAEDFVLSAFERVPRHRFVDSAFVPQAYEDTSLPIGHGQTISKPSVVARMLQLLVEAPGRLRGGAEVRLGRVLEIGTGCGYQAALLALLSERLTSVERIAALHHGAQARLSALKSELPLCSIQLLLADGSLGRLGVGPYDAIIAAAGGEAIPEAWLQQLAPGGRLVAPVARGAGGQRLMVVDRVRGGEGSQEWRLTECEGVSFVPLKSGVLV